MNPSAAPPPPSPGSLGAGQLRDRILDRELDLTAAVEQTLDGIERRNDELGAFLHVDREGALGRAETLQRELDEGLPPGPLFGVPVAFKANYCLEGRPTSCGSRLLEEWTAPYTSTAAGRLLAAGAIPIGSTNMDEFAMGSSGENSAFGPTRNPWDPSRAPGGSSSGSTVAVAAGLVPLALGSDTGGSVRQPAALCGVSGFKPTYGRVSRYGLVAFGSSLDCVSPLARSVEDLERALVCLSGEDPLDSTCLGLPPLSLMREREDLKGLRVGVPEEYFPAELEPGVRERVEQAVDTLVEQLGAVRVPVRLPHTEFAIATYYVIATAEASANLARFDGVRFGRRREGDGSLDGMFAATRGAGFGEEVQRRILLGTYALSSGYHEAWYDRALRVRRCIAQDFERAFEQADVLLGPTSPTTAFELGSRTTDPVAMYLSDVLTVPASLAGLPAVSVPCGLVEGSPGSKSAGPLPVGLQLLGPRLEDARVLGVARLFQRATEHHRARPAARETTRDSDGAAAR